MSEPEGTTWKWVKVSTELLAELEEWSEPVRVMVVTDDDETGLEMVFERVAARIQGEAPQESPTEAPKESERRRIQGEAP